MMKTLPSLVIAVVALLAANHFVSGAEGKKIKPYPLTTCLVTDEKIGADPGMKPYVFTHEGREVKLCCKSCLKDFKKDTAKYMAKIDAAEKNGK